jgi:hypothetical protein
VRGDAISVRSAEAPRTFDLPSGLSPSEIFTNLVIFPGAVHKSNFYAEAGKPLTTLKM